jgi:hypothetical protein
MSEVETPSLGTKRPYRHSKEYVEKRMATNAEFSNITTSNITTEITKGYDEEPTEHVEMGAEIRPEHFAQVDFLRGEHLHPQIRRIFAAILANERVICQYANMNIQLHFNVDDSNPVFLEMHCKFGT